MTPLTVSATDSSVGTSLTYSAPGLPTGLSIDATTGTITGVPSTAGIYPVTVVATDGLGAAGSTSFTWTITNVLVIANPGNQSTVSGSAVTPVHQVAADSSPTVTLYSTAGGALAAGTLDQRRDRDDQRHAHDGRLLRRHRHRVRRRRVLGVDRRHLDGDQRGHRGEPR